MSTPLVPIAISSQLDVTGEERIHAANYTPTEREVFVPPSYYYFAFATSEVDYTRLGYARFNADDNTFAELAVLDRDGSHATGSAGLNVGGNLVAKVEFDNVNVAPDQESGVYLLGYDGTSTLNIIDFWQYSAAEDHDYLDIAKYDDTTVACVVREGVGLTTKLVAITVGASTLTTAGNDLEIDASSGDDYSLCVHNGVLIVLDFDSVQAARSLRAYTFDGADWTLAGTSGTTLSGSFGAVLSPVLSDDDYIYLSNGMIFTYAAGTFTLIATSSLAGIGNLVGVIPSGPTNKLVLYQDGTTSIKTFLFDGNTSTIFDTLTQSVVPASRGVTLDSTGIVLIPGPIPYPDAHSGRFLFSGSLSWQAPLELTGGSTYAALSRIDGLG